MSLRWACEEAISLSLLMLCEHPCLHLFYCYKPEAYRTICPQVPSRLLDQDDRATVMRTSSSRLDYNILDQDGRATIRRLETQVQRQKKDIFTKKHLNATFFKNYTLFKWSQNKEKEFFLIFFWLIMNQNKMIYSHYTSYQGC